MRNQDCCGWLSGLFRFWKPLLKVGFIIFLLSLAVVFIVSYLSHVIPNFFDIPTSGAHSNFDSFPVELNAAVAIFMTLALVVVAWVQLAGIQGLDRSKFLLQISDRYGAKPIIKAREIIHELYRKSVEDNPSCSEGEYRGMIGQRIIDFSKSNNPAEMKKYVALLNMLDFLETIAYMANKDELKIKDLSELLGNSICFYFEIFRPKILQRREKYGMNSFYTEFEQLYIQMKKTS